MDKSCVVAIELYLHFRVFGERIEGISRIEYVEADFVFICEKYENKVG